MENIQNVPGDTGKLTTRDAGGQQDSGVRTGNFSSSLRPSPGEEEIVSTVGSRAFKRALDPTAAQIRQFNTNCRIVKEIFNAAITKRQEEYADYVGYTLCQRESGDQKKIHHGKQVQLDTGIVTIKDLIVGTSFSPIGWVKKDGTVVKTKVSRKYLVLSQHSSTQKKRPESTDLYKVLVKKDSKWLDAMPTERRFWYETVSAGTRNQVLFQNVESAFKNFFAGRADYPRKKKRNDSFSVQSTDFKIRSPKAVKLGIGVLDCVKLREPIEIPRPDPVRVNDHRDYD